MIKAIIFDLGGVVLNNGVYEAYRKFKNVRFKEIFEKKYLIPMEKGEIGETSLWQRLTYDLGEKLSTTLLKKYIFNNFYPIDNNIFLIKRLRRKYKVGLLTNNLVEWYTRLDSQFRLEEKFDTIIVSAEVGMRKPDEGIYCLAAQRLKVTEKECIFIDDKKENIKGAEEVGMKGIFYKQGDNLTLKLEKMGVKI
ncbi:MAG: HAD-IA family hydrolase [Candidatus Aenigmarchaeota archaeon]|nr:HAD-IA family hydrolase [Candidatus Aenigmarchaeota archaeon]